MAAGGSRSRVSRVVRRGADTRRGASIRREGPAPLPPLLLAPVPALDSLEEICGWLGTYRERLRQARRDEEAELTAVVRRLEARYHSRRAELS